MKVPKKIKTLTKLSNWVKLNKPETIEIYPTSGVAIIGEFSKMGWNTFEGVPIIYCIEIK